MILTAVAAIAVSSCDNANSKADNKSQTNGKPTELKLAYVEIDSIMTQYNFCKEYSKVLEKTEYPEHTGTETAGLAECRCQLPAETAAECLHP